jgi:hypothetical protein
MPVFELTVNQDFEHFLFKIKFLLHVIIFFSLENQILFQINQINT